MSSRLIEDCFNQEVLEHLELPDRYTTIKIPKGTTLIVVDPYYINMEDLERCTPGSVMVVRLRRPVWGRDIKILYLKWSYNYALRS